MSEIRSEFLETTADFKTESLPLSHVSVEVGHLCMEDLALGPESVARALSVIAPWVQAVKTPRGAGVGKKQVRVSTCFLVDDYFGQLSSPAEVIPMILAAARREELDIDYLARESACASAGTTSPAQVMLGGLVTEPVPGTTGARPPVTETGWLTNGQRSPSTARNEAMSGRIEWQPPRESARRQHSVFVDVELWRDSDDERLWSCAMLAAVWQLIRLGMLRDQGRPLLTPQDWAEDEFPDSWDDLPPLIRLNPKAAAFNAYTTYSIMPARFLPTELAVRTILGQFAGDQSLLAEASSRAGRDAMPLPEELVDRIRYVFATAGSADLGSGEHHQPQEQGKAHLYGGSLGQA